MSGSEPASPVAADRCASGSPYRVAVHLLVLALLACLFGVVELPIPVGQDQGILAYVAMDILDGGVPYLTTWDHKPPGAHILVALAFWLFGETPMAMRLFDVIYVYLIAVLLYRVGTQLFAREAGLWGGILFLIGYFARVDWWNKLQPDQYVLVPVLGAVAITLSDAAGSRRRTPVLAGAFVGIAFLIKFIALVAVVPLLFWYLMHVSLRREPRRVLAAMALFLSGFLIPCGTLYAWLAGAGAWEGFVDAVFVFNAGYVATGREAPWAVFVTFWHLRALTALAVAGVLSVLARSRFAAGAVADLRAGRPGVVLALILLSVFVLEVIAQGKGYTYHFVPVLSFLTLIAGLGMYQANRALRVLGAGRPWVARIAKLPALTLAIVVLLPFVDTQVQKAESAMSFIDGSVDLEKYYRRFGGYNDPEHFSYQAAWEVARHLAENTQADDHVYVWGFEPIINVLAHRRQPTRYSYNTPLVVDWRKPSWRETFLDELEEQPPLYLVVTSQDAHPWTTGSERDSYQLMLEEFRELADFVADRYALETRLERYRLYRLAE
jgi:hypothetical protein